MALFLLVWGFVFVLVGGFFRFYLIFIGTSNQPTALLAPFHQVSGAQRKIQMNLRIMRQLPSPPLR